MAITISVVTSPSPASGPSPLGVTFDASGTTSGATTRPFFECKYSWAFTPSANVVPISNEVTPDGTPVDPAAGFGPIVSRVFTGNVTATLTVTEPGGLTAQDAVAVTVAAESTY